jgi:hypothetical protein
MSEPSTVHLIEKYYNETTKTLHLPYDFNEELTNIPLGTERILIGVISFCFMDKCSQFKKSVDNLPNTLTHLIFSHVSRFNQKIDKLPNTLTHLTMGSNFNQSVDNLPQSLIQLRLGTAFNKSVDNLPKFLTHLTLGICFNQKIDNLPSSLTHLIVQDDFNQSIDNLPNSLQYLSIGLPRNGNNYASSRFNQTINNLPILLKKFKMCETKMDLLEKIPFGCKVKYYPQRYLD